MKRRTSAVLVLAGAIWLGCEDDTVAPLVFPPDAAASADASAADTRVDTPVEPAPTPDAPMADAAAPDAPARMDGSDGGRPDATAIDRSVTSDGRADAGNPVDRADALAHDAGG